MCPVTPKTLSNLLQLRKKTSMPSWFLHFVSWVDGKIKSHVNPEIWVVGCEAWTLDPVHPFTTKQSTMCTKFFLNWDSFENGAWIAINMNFAVYCHPQPHICIIDNQQVYLLELWYNQPELHKKQLCSCKGKDTILGKESPVLTSIKSGWFGERKYLKNSPDKSSTSRNT